MIREDRYLDHMRKVHPKDLPADLRKEMAERETQREKLAIVGKEARELARDFGRLDFDKMCKKFELIKKRSPETYRLALKELSRTIDDPYSLMAIGLELLSLNEFETAEDLFARCLNFYHDSMGLYCAMATARLCNHDYQGAREAIELLASRYEWEEEDKLLEVEEFTGPIDPIEIIEEKLSALKDGGNLIHLIRGLLEGEDLKATVEEEEKEKDPLLPSFIGSLTDDEELLQKALEIDPDYAIAHTLYAEYLLSCERIDESMRECEISISLSQKNKKESAHPYALLGDVQQELGMTKSARESYSIAFHT